MKTELLERLSKAAPEMFSISKNMGAPFMVRYPDGECFFIYKSKLKNREAKQLLFGAICEKIEAEGWFYMVKNMSHPISRDLKYYEVHVSTDSAHKNFYVGESRGEDSSHPWEAAALALCEALESKRKPTCPQCNGEGIDFTDTAHQGMCDCLLCEGRGVVDELPECVHCSYTIIDGKRQVYKQCQECTGKQQEVVG